MQVEIGGKWRSIKEVGRSKISILRIMHIEFQERAWGVRGRLFNRPLKARIP